MDPEQWKKDNKQILLYLFLQFLAIKTLDQDPDPNPHPNLDRLKRMRSVADPGCFSWIPDPDFYPSMIPDPKTATK
jgi:hypothetical protein